MAKLSKAAQRAHAAAVALIESGRPLTLDEIEQCYQDWHEGAENNQTAASAFFTPIGMASDLRFDMPMHGSFVDLCAGTGRLAYFAGGQHLWREFRHQYDRIVCVERNPDYVRIGKRLFPDAEWICGDALDPAVHRQIGNVDFAIANPPFGKMTESDFAAPRYKGAEFELKVLDVMATLAPEGWAIVPAMTAPWDSRGMQREASKAKAFTKATGLPLHRFANVDASYYRDEWRGTSPAVDFVGFDCTENAPLPVIAAQRPTLPATIMAPPAMAKAGQMELAL